MEIGRLLTTQNYNSSYYKCRSNDQFQWSEAKPWSDAAVSQLFIQWSEHGVLVQGLYNLCHDAVTALSQCHDGMTTLQRPQRDGLTTCYSKNTVLPEQCIFTGSQTW